MNVVHLEDDGPLREVLKVALTAAMPSIGLHQFSNSNDAVAYIESHKESIDLFILDIRVPGTLDGLGVAKRIRELECTGAIIITSAYQSPKRDMLRSLDADWYPKPWHITEVIPKMLDIAKQSKPTVKTA